MLIVLDKTSKKIINNMGTNSLYPDGKLPNAHPRENEFFIRLHDDSEFAKLILTSFDYELVLDENNSVIDVIVHKTLEEHRSEQPIEPHTPTAEERLLALENTALLLMMEGMM